MSEQDGVPSSENLYQNFISTRYSVGEIAMMSISRIAGMVRQKRGTRPDKIPLTDEQIAARVRDAARGMGFVRDDMPEDQRILVGILDMQWELLSEQKRQTRHLGSISNLVTLFGLLILLGMIVTALQSCGAL